MAESSAASFSMGPDKQKVERQTAFPRWSKWFRSWKEVLLLELLSLLEPRKPAHLD